MNLQTKVGAEGSKMILEFLKTNQPQLEAIREDPALSTDDRARLMVGFISTMALLLDVLPEEWQPYWDVANDYSEEAKKMAKKILENPEEHKSIWEEFKKFKSK